MGYALFTARKLSCNTRLNNCNSRIMVNSNSENVLTTRISNTQKAINIWTSNQKNAIYNKFKSQVASIEYDADSKEYNTAKEEIEAARTQKLDELEQEISTKNESIELLNQEQTLLDMERTSLETEMNAINSELESVKEAEKSYIKNSTAKFAS